ncbi:hypothetical protein OROGR_014457 [Orobanche gracilis]
MADSDNQALSVDGELAEKGYAMSGKIMLSAIVILFAVVVFMVALHLYARWYLVRLRRRQIERRRVHRRVSRSQIVMYVDSRLSVGESVAERGLDRAVLNSLPVFIYSRETEEEEKEEEEPPLECAVCLSEFEEKEIVRLLPKCGHSFHIECIDMWFRSHSTCPLCRSPVEHVVHRRHEMVEKPVEPAEKSNGPEPSSSSSSGTEDVECNTTSLVGRRKGPGPVGVTIEVPPRRPGLENESSPVGRLLSLKRILSMRILSPATTPSGAGTSRGGIELDLESGIGESTGDPSHLGIE